MEAILLETMFDLPSLEGVEQAETAPGGHEGLSTVRAIITALSSGSLPTCEKPVEQLAAGKNQMVRAIAAGREKEGRQCHSQIRWRRAFAGSLTSCLRDFWRISAIAERLKPRCCGSFYKSARLKSHWANRPQIR